jgi:hypothetical protein
MENITIRQPSSRLAGAALISVVLTLLFLYALEVFHGW